MTLAGQGHELLGRVDPQDPVPARGEMGAPVAGPAAQVEDLGGAELAFSIGRRDPIGPVLDPATVLPFHLVHAAEQVGVFLGPASVSSNGTDGNLLGPAHSCGGISRCRPSTQSRASS
jgi:hypothetical protein